MLIVQQVSSNTQQLSHENTNTEKKSNKTMIKEKNDTSTWKNGLKDTKKRNDLPVSRQYSRNILCNQNYSRFEGADFILDRSIALVMRVCQTNIHSYRLVNIISANIWSGSCTARAEKEKGMLKVLKRRKLLAQSALDSSSHPVTQPATAYR